MNSCPGHFIHQILNGQAAGAILGRFRALFGDGGFSHPGSGPESLLLSGSGAQDGPDPRPSTVWMIEASAKLTDRLRLKQ
jgi:hypothetical protein